MNTPATPAFWSLLAKLVETSDLVIDRPRGTHHPRYPEVVYPLDYGYLRGTQAGDGDGIDVWRGSQANRSISAIVCTVDTLKRDAEIKILLGCTPTEIQTVLTFHRWQGDTEPGVVGQQAAILVMPPEAAVAAAPDPPMPHEQRSP